MEKTGIITIAQLLKVVIVFLCATLAACSCSEQEMRKYRQQEEQRIQIEKEDAEYAGDMYISKIHVKGRRTNVNYYRAEYEGHSYLLTPGGNGPDIFTHLESCKCKKTEQKKEEPEEKGEGYYFDY